MATHVNLKSHRQTGTPVGDVIDMGASVRKLRIVASGACWVRASFYEDGEAAPSAPSVTPAPAQGAEAANGWILMAAGDVYEPTPGFGTQQGLAFRYVEVWEMLADAYVVCEELPSV